MDSNKDLIRQYRSTLNSIADYILSNEKSVLEFGSSLEWQDLEEFPIWIIWDEEKINKMIMIAGTIFLLPSIKMWIDSNKIKEVNELIGADVFAFIISNTNVNTQRVSQINITNITENIKSSGASVIFSCYSIRLRPWLSQTLPNSKGKLNQKLAQEILKHTLFVLDSTQLHMNEDN